MLVNNDIVITDKASTVYSISHLVSCNFKYHHVIFLDVKSISGSGSINFERSVHLFPFVVTISLKFGGFLTFRRN